MDLARRHPLDVLGGVRDRLEIRRDQRRPQPPGVAAVDGAHAFAALSRVLGVQVADALEDPPLVLLEEELRTAAGDPAARDAYPPNWDASRALARAAYAAVRAVRPAAVVEVGVAAGLSSSYICAALEANGEGHLHSVDPVLGGEDEQRHIGWLVPERLQARRTLHRGRSRRLLGPLLREHRPGVVLLDGMHTEPTMRWEVRRAGALVAPGGVLLVDDAERNPAFARWAMSADTAWWSLVETEHAGHVFGAAVLPAPAG